MNTKKALQKFLSESSSSMQEIDRQIGIRRGSTAEIINDISYPVGIKLLRVQEFLIRKGFKLEELQKLPEYLVRFRALIFDGKIVFDDKFLKKTNISRNSTFYHFLKTGRINRNSLDLILEALKEAEGKSSDTKPSLTVRQMERTTTAPKSNDNLLMHLQYALTVINIEGAEFLKTSTKEERVKLREKLGTNLLFDATNNLSGLSSEKARELQKR